MSGKLLPLQPLPTLNDLLADHQRIEELSSDAARALLFQVTALLPALAAHVASSPMKSERILTPAEAAPMLGLTVAALYKRARAGKYDFTMRTPGVRELRFSETGLRKWINDQSKKWTPLAEPRRERRSRPPLTRGVS